MPGGRPTKYDPAHCEAAIDFMAQGYSVTAFAGHIGVARATVYEWEAQHQEFSDALKTGRAKAAEWWESRLRDIAKGENGNATAAIFALKNRVPDEWRDRQEVAHDVADPMKELFEYVATNNRRLNQS